MLDIVKKHLADFSSSNWDGYKATLAADVVCDEVATHRRVVGADDFIRLVQGWKRAFSDLKGDLIDCYIAGDKAIAEIEWEGTHDGPLEGPFGTLPATNKKGRTRAVMVYSFKNGKIQEMHHYFDLLTILSQIGLTPAIGMQPEAKGPAGAGAQPKH